MQMFRVLYDAAGTNDASKAAADCLALCFDIAALNAGAAKELCRDCLTPIYGKVNVVSVTPIAR